MITPPTLAASPTIPVLMSSDTSPHTDASEQQHPPVILIVPDGPLPGTTEPLIDGRFPAFWTEAAPRGLRTMAMASALRVPSQ